VTVAEQPAKDNKDATPRWRILATISVAVVSRLRRYAAVI